MGLFRRTPAPSPEPDAAIDFMTKADADFLRSETVRVLAQAGREAHAEADQIVTTDGHAYSIHPIARKVQASGQPREDWSRTITGHLTPLLNMPSIIPTALDRADLERQVIVRLLNQGANFDGSLDYASDVAPGLIEVLALDLPDTVGNLGSNHVERLDDVPGLYRHGRANLTALLQSEAFEVERIERDGHWFTCVMSDCVYTSSLPLIMDAAMTRFAPDQDLTHGVLWCAPFRHQFAFRVVTDTAAILDGVTVMSSFAVLGFNDGVTPLSPFVYHHHEGRNRPVTFVDQGELKVNVGPYLEGLIDAW